MSDLLAKLNWLTKAGQYTDYRPVIGPGDDVVIFERRPMPVGNGPPKLYANTDFTTKNAAPFIKPVPVGPPLPEIQTRADIQWETGTVVFNGGWKFSEYRVFTVGANGQGVHLFGSRMPQLSNAYPTWIQGSGWIITANFGEEASPVPRNTVYADAGRLVQQNINGAVTRPDLTKVPVYAGMPAIGPNPNRRPRNTLPPIAFAGQPVVDDWGGPNSPGYDQEKNYIFLNKEESDGTFTSAPMESDAPLDHFDAKYQGRAPAWSPDGSTIAFESNRSGHYAIHLHNLATGTTSDPITNPNLNAQHAKFFAGGAKLVFAIQYRAGSWRGIAWVPTPKFPWS